MIKTLIKFSFVGFLFSIVPVFSQENKPAEGIDTSYKLLQPEIIYYKSNGLNLKGFLFKPSGSGPFPVYLWNHGSEKDPKFDKLVAKFWLDRGFIFFKPIRSGHGGNPGNYIADVQKAYRDSSLTKDEIFARDIMLHEKANVDVIAAIKWMKEQPNVDLQRFIVAGGSYGGIQTLITAMRDGESDLGIKCFVAMSPAAMSWNPNWQKKSPEIVQKAKKPIFLLQAKNDFNLGPSETLGQVLEKKGFPNRSKIFPEHVMPGGDPNDHKQGHGMFFGDPPAWSDEVLKYLTDCGVIYKK